MDSHAPFYPMSPLAARAEGQTARMLREGSPKFLLPDLAVMAIIERAIRLGVRVRIEGE